MNQKEHQVSDQSKKLVELIQANRKLEANELFNHIMANRAIEHVEQFKQNIAKQLFNGK